MLFCPLENLIKMVALCTNSLCVRISNVNPYHANNIFFILKVSFATVDMTDMFCIYTCLGALY